MGYRGSIIDPFKELSRHFHVPEQPVDPVEVDDETFAKNLRNQDREDGIKAINTLNEVLSNLSDEHGNGFQNTLKDLAELKDYLERDFE